MPEGQLFVEPAANNLSVNGRCQCIATVEKENWAGTPKGYRLAQGETECFTGVGFYRAPHGMPPMSTILILVTFALGLLGILGNTTHEDRPFPRNIKPLGYLVAVLLVLSLGITLINQNSDSRNRDRLAQAALYEVQLEGYRFLASYFEFTDPPHAYDEFDFSRPFAEYNALGSGKPLLSVPCQVDYRLGADKSNSNSETYGTEWSRSMDRFSSQLEANAILYQGALSDEIIQTIATIVTHPWVEFVGVLDARSERWSKRTGLPYLPLDQREATSTCGPGEDGKFHHGLSQEFSELLVGLEALVNKERERIRNRGIKVQDSFIHEKRSFWYSL